MKIIRENIKLNEDKVVKFGGKTYPNFGWCVYLMGGGGSGKGANLKTKLPINGRYFNVDDFKEIISYWDTHDENGVKRSDKFKTPEEERTSEKNGKKELNGKNSKFVSELHQEFDSVGDKRSDSILNNPANTNKDRLPNIIFDKTGKSLNSILKIIEPAKEHGYKTCLVWVLTDIDLAQANNLKRDRTVDPVTLSGTHSGAATAVKQLFDSGKIKDIDEFWIIDATAYKAYDKDNYVKENNVYRFDTKHDSLYKYRQINQILGLNNQKFNH